MLNDAQGEDRAQVERAIAQATLWKEKHRG
jgi:hypothetical protein